MVLFFRSKTKQKDKTGTEGEELKYLTSILSITYNIHLFDTNNFNHLLHTPTTYMHRSTTPRATN